MALDLSARYPGQLDVGDPGYPYGKGRNVDVEGDGNGTPYERDLLNDILGFHQALLVTAGIEPSEVPDTALASQYLQSLYRLLGRAEGWGALGDDATNDTSALQAGLNAVAAYGSDLQEFHLAPGRIYRHTGLIVPTNVSIVFHGATLKITHATNNHLTYSGTGAASRQFLLLDRPVFAASVAATGAVVFIAVPSIPGSTLRRIQVRGADATHPNLQGKFLESEAGTNSYVTVESTEWSANASKQFVHVRSGELTVLRCRCTLPETYSGAVIEVASACQVRIDDTYANFAAHTSGTAQFVKLTSAAASLFVGKLHALGTNTADVAIQWTAAALIVETGLRVSGGMQRYDGGSTVLQSGSSLSLLPHAILDIVHDSTFALPSGVRAVSLRGEFNTQPVQVTMPAMYFEGQEFDLEFYNKSGSDPLALVEINAVGADIVANDPNDLNAGYIRSGRFRVMRNFINDRWDWLQIGDWSPFIFHGHYIGS